MENIERINITLTDVPVDLHRAWKAMAALNDLSMKDALLAALKYWIQGRSREMEVNLSSPPALLGANPPAQVAAGATEVPNGHTSSDQPE